MEATQYQIRIAIDLGSTVSAMGWSLRKKEEDGDWTVDPERGWQAQFPTVMVEARHNPGMTQDRFAEDAMKILRQKNVVCTSEFKSGLFSLDPEQRQTATDHTVAFLSYLRSFFESNNNLTREMFRDSQVEVCFTVPVVASFGVRKRYKDMFLSAGFTPQNGYDQVRDLDEGNSLVDLAMEQAESPLREELRRLSRDPQSCAHVLLVDIGGLTADVKVMEMRFDAQSATQYQFVQRSAYPAPERRADTGSLGGGIMLDKAIKDYLVENGFIDKNEAEELVKNKGYLFFRTFKEKLNDRYWRVGEDGPESLALLDGIKVVGNYKSNSSKWLSRKLVTEQIAAENIRLLNEGVRSVIREANLTEAEIDWVFLTGGGSNIFYLRPLLLGQCQLPDGCVPLQLTKIQENPDRRIFPRQTENAEHTMSCVKGTLLYTGKLILTANAKYRIHLQLYTVWNDGREVALGELWVPLTEKNQVFPVTVAPQTASFPYIYTSEMRSIVCTVLLVQDEYEEDMDASGKRKMVGGKTTGQQLADAGKLAASIGWKGARQAIPAGVLLLIAGGAKAMHIPDSSARAAAAHWWTNNRFSLEETLKQYDFDPTRTFEDTVTVQYSFQIDQGGALTGEVFYRAKATQNAQKPIRLELG